MELQGFLTINWAALHAWLGAKAQLLDQNGDGKLDAKDAHVLAVRAARCQRLHAERARRLLTQLTNCRSLLQRPQQSRFSAFMSATAPSAAGVVAGFSFGMM